MTTLHKIFSLKTSKIPLSPKTLRKSLKKTLSFGTEKMTISLRNLKITVITTITVITVITEHRIKKLYYWTLIILTSQICHKFWYRDMLEKKMKITLHTKLSSSKALFVY